MGLLTQETEEKMKTVPISFCNDTVTVEQLVEHNDKNAVLESIRMSVDLTADQKYYRVMREQSDANLLHFPHVFSLVSSGFKYWLYLTQLNHTNCCVLVERRIRNGYPYPKMVLPLLDFDDTLFSNTLFEVEIVQLTDDKRHVILISDLVMFKNRNAREWDPLRRFSTIHMVMKKHFRENAVNQPCPLQVKRLFTRASWKEMLKFQQKLPYKTRGLILFPVNPRFRIRLWLDGKQELEKVGAAAAKASSNEKIASRASEVASGGARDECIVVKEWLRWQSESVLDALRWCFLLESTSHADIYNLYLKIEEKLVYYDIAYVSSLDSSNMIRDAFEKCSGADAGAGAGAGSGAGTGAGKRLPVLCTYNRKFRKWCPHMLHCEDPIKNVIRAELFAFAKA